jgi:hypothetical protein
MDCPVAGHSYIFTYTIYAFYILPRLRAFAAKKYITVFRDWPFKLSLILQAQISELENMCSKEMKNIQERTGIQKTSFVIFYILYV